MLMYFGSVIYYFVFDKLKNKLINVFFYRSSVKMIMYTSDWHNKNRNGSVLRLIDFVFCDNYFL